jgi:large subunit ribosomal protein L30
MEALVQIRGEVNIPSDVRDTLGMLNLHATNQCTLVPETDAYRGMITKVNEYVAHGEPSADVVATLLRRRAEPETGDDDVTDEWVAGTTDYADLDELASALVAEETTLRDVGLSPSIRLHPPRGGHEGVKHPTKESGQLGKHATAEIDRLLEDMR